MAHYLAYIECTVDGKPNSLIILEDKTNGENNYRIACLELRIDVGRAYSFGSWSNHYFALAELMRMTTTDDLGYLQWSEAGKDALIPC